MVITGISMEKGEKEGKLVFFDKNTFEKVQELSVTNSVSYIVIINFLHCLQIALKKCCVGLNLNYGLIKLCPFSM